MLSRTCRPWLVRSRTLASTALQLYPGLDGSAGLNDGGRLGGATWDHMRLTRTICAPACTALGIQSALRGRRALGEGGVGAEAEPETEGANFSSGGAQAEQHDRNDKQPKASRRVRIQLVRRRRMSASTAAARTLPIRTMGNRGPSPPPLVEPLRALTTLAAGDDPSLAEAAEADEAGPVALARTDEAGPVALARADDRGRCGAVASARAAAATPAGPCSASACWVEGLIALPPPVPPPLDVLPGPPGRPTAPPTGWTVSVGWPPPAVGTVSTYWPTPEFPGGAIVRFEA